MYNLYNLALSILAGAIGGIIVLLVGYLLDKPKLIALTPEWKRRKGVGTSIIDAASNKQTFLPGGYYYFYGITIKNQKRWIPRLSAEITYTTMKILDNTEKVIADERQCRWWTIDYATLDPLFMSSKADIEQRRRRTIGAGAEENIVLFYRNEEQSTYYRFTIATDTNNGFPVLDDKLSGTMPYKALIKIKGNRIEENINLLINIDPVSKDLLIQIDPKS